MRGKVGDAGNSKQSAGQDETRSRILQPKNRLNAHANGHTPPHAHAHALLDLTLVPSIDSIIGFDSQHARGLLGWLHAWLLTGSTAVERLLYGLAVFVMTVVTIDLFQRSTHCTVTVIGAAAAAVGLTVLCCTVHNCDGRSVS